MGVKKLYVCVINGKDAINMALAGVGTPIKDSDCRVSILNLANRMAEKTGINKAINTIGFVLSSTFEIS